MNIAISLQNISKEYYIGQHIAGRRSLLRTLLPNSRKIDKFWSLSDVTVDIYEGQAIALIGDNGSGKSTLLRIISNITVPTSGQAIINGRVGSLLDVGAGLWDELTGFENIYMNGAILGMTKQEIESQISSIIEFCEIGKFMQTPVRRFSSGMRMRLAFSIAVHQLTDILIIDEVLAVGDEAFREKCQKRIAELAKSGRTIIVVSHFPEMLLALCNRALVIDTGKLVFDGSVTDALKKHATLKIDN